MKKPLRILIVEDNVIVAMDISSRIKNMGYEVTSCVTRGETAVKEAIENPPDIILMDIQLKGKMNGIEAAKAIKAETEIDIIFLSAFADKSIGRESEKIKPLGYLTKPVSDKELMDLIKKQIIENP